MSKLTVLISVALIAVGAFADTYKYIGGNGMSSTSGDWNNDWNAATDYKTGVQLWEGGAPASGNDYVIDKNFDVWFHIADNSGTFKGNSLTIDTGRQVTFNADDHYLRLTVKNLSLGEGSTLASRTQAGYNNWPHGLWLTGTPHIDGTLLLYHKVPNDASANYFSGYLHGNLTGHGNVELRGFSANYPVANWHNWCIDGDNSGFSGKFVFRISEAMSQGEACATGVEITNANALGGARDSFTPNAVEIKSWNGLVTVGSDITLNAANSGILMQTNSFFEVPANRVLTVAEPIRMTGGFFKKGAGTLALTGGFSFGADGNAVADGVNSALTVKDGILRVTQANDLADIDVSMANGTTIELAGTTTATFRSLSAAGVLKVAVDCTGLTPGSTQTITLNMPRASAEALVGKVDVMAKGAYATIGWALTLTETGVTVTLKVPSVTTWHNYTGAGYNDSNPTHWNDEKDASDSTKYLWDSKAAAVGTDGYTVDQSLYFVSGGSSAFNGGALHVKSGTLTISGGGANGQLSVPNMTVDAGAQLRFSYSYNHYDGPVLLQGNLWRIDGTLGVAITGSDGDLCPTAPMIGSGLVTYGGWGYTAKSRNQSLQSDNSRFRGKFKVALPNTATGADKAAGLRIVDANALGGALGVMTPDALTLNANNGLIVGETLSLVAENRGILMQTNAYFEVESGKTLTLKEPIRVVNGILKKGSGTLAIGGDVTIGEDGATSPNGTNNKLTVQAGTIKAASTNGIAKLAFEFASGTKMEVDAFPTDDGVASAGFYLADDTPFTAADAKIPLNIAFPDGYKIEEDVNVVLCTVKSTNVDSVMNRITITTTGLVRKGLRSFWTEDSGNGLTRIGCKFERTGLLLIVE